MQTKHKKPRRIKCDEDRISLLPDCLLIEIISLIPCTKQAIKTGTLSKRWKNLWTNVQDVNIRNAAISDHSFYINSSFTHMKLDGCELNPTGVIGWSNLKSLCIKSGHVSESLIKNILSGSPLLETLKLQECGGFCRIDITSKSVKNLVFAGYTDEWDDIDIYSTTFNFEIYAPHILSLTIEEDFPASSDFTLLNVSSLVEATLDYCENDDHYFENDDSGYLELKSQDDHGETLKDLIVNLCHVKRLKIEGYCVETLARLKAKGFIFPSNMEHPELPAYVSSESEDSSDNDSTEGEDCSDTDSTKSEDCSDNDSTESED